MTDFEESWTRIRRLAAGAAVGVAWRQWRVLGAQASPIFESPVEDVVDPEALILVSLAFQEEERRLEDFVRWWAHAGADLTSVQRLRTLADEMGPEATEDLGVFAGWAAEAGHRSWSRYAPERGPEGASPPERDLKGPGAPRLLEPATLMLRLRAAFGVGAKPDVLSLLIGLEGDWAPVSLMSRALGYTETAVRQGVKDMVVAGLVRESSGRPASYRVEHRSWAELLKLGFDDGDPGTSEGPSWAMWPALFSFLRAAHQLAERAVACDESEHVLASGARDAVESHRFALDFHRISLPSPGRYPGREFVGAFLRITEEIAAWALPAPTEVHHTAAPSGPFSA